MVEVQELMKVGGMDITIGFVIGAALAYYAARHYFLTGKGA